MVLNFVWVMVANEHLMTAFECLPRKMHTKYYISFFEIKYFLNTIQGFSEETISMQLGTWGTGNSPRNVYPKIAYVRKDFSCCLYIRVPAIYTVNLHNSSIKFSAKIII